jgi:hypothetical protein
MDHAAVLQGESLMSKTTTLSLLAGAGVALGSAPAAFAADQAYTNADEVRSIVSEMLADAETRSSLMTSAGAGGYDDGFYLADSTGNFRLNITGAVQFRYTLNFRDKNDELDESDFDSGFSTPRTDLQFNGNVINPNIFYTVWARFDSDGGSFDLSDAFVGYRFDNGFYLKWGQFRAQFLREDNVRGYYQLAADRSLTNQVFRQGNVQGIELGYESEDFRIIGAFSDGLNSANSEFSSNPSYTAFYDPITGDLSRIAPGIAAQGAGETDLAFTLRAEIKFAGTWDQFTDFTSMPGDEFAWMLGFAGHFQYTDSDRVTITEVPPPAVPAGTGGNQWYGSWTVDLSFEGNGWNFFFAGVGGYSQYDDITTNNGTGDRADRTFDDYGLVAQGGIFIPESDWEFFVRYDGTFFDDNDRAPGGTDTFSTVTFGTNWYWSGHAAKFTFDVQWFLDSRHQILVREEKLGWLGSGNDNEFSLRFQFQLLF